MPIPVLLALLVADVSSIRTLRMTHLDFELYHLELELYVVRTCVNLYFIIILVVHGFQALCLLRLLKGYHFPL